MLTRLLLHSHSPPLLAIQKHYLESCPEALQQLSIHSKYRTTLFSDRWYTHVSEVLLRPSSAAVRCKMAAMCGPDCDDVMDDVSNSH